MKNKFVLFGVPRVGSNYFISLLNRHPDLRCHYEVFSADKVYLSWSDGLLENHPDWLRFKDPAWRDADPIRFLHQLLHCGDETIKGFNIFPNQNDDVIRHVCQSGEFAHVFIRRRNLLRSYISQTIAENNNAWNSLKSNALTLDDKRFSIDVADFDRYQRRIQSFYASLMDQLQAAGTNYHLVEYEAFVGDREELNRCFAFLGLPAICDTQDTVFQKENRETVEQIIVNYSQLTDYCQDRGLTSWLGG